jgi:hypothetical protein
MSKQQVLVMVGAMLAIWGPAGCGSGPPRPADPSMARQALERALSAWKEGKSADSLKGESPPIVVSDHAWRNGARLIKYEIAPGDRGAGADRSFQVVLWLEGQQSGPRPRSKGKGTDRGEKVEYNVGTDPILTVVRPF